MGRFLAAPAVSAVFLFGLIGVGVGGGALMLLPSESFAEAQARSENVSAAAAAGLDKTRWRIDWLAGSEAGMAGDMHFEGNRIDGATACNFYSANIETGDAGPSASGGSGSEGRKPAKGQLTIEVDRMTRKGCSGEAFELERGLVEAMKSTAAYERQGDRLVLSDEAGKPVLKMTLKPTFTLERTPLKIISYLHDGGLYNVEPGSKPTIRFANGKVSGQTGCTRFEGQYRLDGETVNIAIEKTEPLTDPCTEGMEQQDTSILKGFDTIGRFDEGRNLIRLLRADKDWAVLWLALDLS